MNMTDTCAEGLRGFEGNLSTVYKKHKRIQIIQAYFNILASLNG
jgi:hypothetical protein